MANDKDFKISNYMKTPTETRIKNGASVLGGDENFNAQKSIIGKSIMGKSTFMNSVLDQSRVFGDYDFVACKVVNKQNLN